MKDPKKILSLTVKSLLGIGCLTILYLKLGKEFSSENINLLEKALFSLKGLVCFFSCLILIPINWGIESLKWQLITAPVEKISFKTAQTSVYSGICLGNFAPGRATEFLGKILYFSDENKTKITVLHFINGIIQLSITLIIGLATILINLSNFSIEYAWLSQTVIILNMILLVGFLLAVININKLLNKVSRLVSRQKNTAHLSYTFSTSLLLQLFSLSLLRYLSFALQFYLLLFLFQPHLLLLDYLPGIALYFLITSTVPMFSFIEAAMRAGIALLVFKNSGVSSSVIALSTILLWLMNIMLPSLVGYIALLRMRFDFKMFHFNKT